MYVPSFLLLFQTESECSKKHCFDVQDWGHVCWFPGKHWGGFRAFTTWPIYRWTYPQNCVWAETYLQSAPSVSDDVKLVL